MKSERPSSSPRSPKHEASSTRDGDRSRGRDPSKPAWLEPWLEAEEEVYDLPCTD